MITVRDSDREFKKVLAYWSHRAESYFYEFLAEIGATEINKDHYGYVYSFSMDEAVSVKLQMLYD